MLATSFHEDGRLVLTPAMACMPGCPRFRKALYDHKTTAGEQHAVDFPSPASMSAQWCTVAIDQTIEAECVLQRDSPQRRLRHIADSPNAGSEVIATRSMTGAGSIPTTTAPCCAAYRAATPGTAPDVYDRLAGAQVAQAHCQSSVTLPAEGHAECSEQPGHTRESGVVGVVIGRCMRFGHVLTLTVEPGFKSSRCMSEAAPDDRGGRRTSTRRHVDHQVLRTPRADRGRCSIVWAAPIQSRDAPEARLRGHVPRRRISP